MYGYETSLIYLVTLCTSQISTWRGLGSVHGQHLLDSTLAGGFSAPTLITYEILVDLEDVYPGKLITDPLLFILTGQKVCGTSK